jgi:hypothetical protein
VTSRDFCFWLKGFFEIANREGGLSPNETATIKRHLALVFKHEIDPSIDGGDPKKKAEADAIHNPPSFETPGTPSFPGYGPNIRC